MSLVTLTFDDVARRLTESLEKELEHCIRAQLKAVSDKVVNDVAHQLAGALKGKVRSYRTAEGEVRVSLILNNVETEVK
jgi:flagellar motor switch protein FliG